MGYVEIIFLRAPSVSTLQKWSPDKISPNVLKQITPHRTSDDYESRKCAQYTSLPVSLSTILCMRHLYLWMLYATSYKMCMFMICHHKKFHMTWYTGSLVITIKLKTKYRLHATFMMFYIPQKHYFIKCCIFVEDLVRYISEI